MFARLSVYDIPSDRRQEADTRFREALARIGESDGFAEAYFLLGCESDRAAALVLWDTFDAMAASRVAASRIRSEAANAVGGEVVSVDEFEIVATKGASG